MLRLLTKLLLAPVTLPVRGVGFVFDEIRAAVDRELCDPDVIRRELLDLSQRLDAGLIDDAAYDVAEAALLARLDAVAQQETGGNVQWS